MNKILAILITTLGMTACSSTQFADDGLRTSAKIMETAERKTTIHSPSDPKNIIITEYDFTDREYISLGDLKVSASKLTIFHQDPTKLDINSRLRQEAAKLGADAVIFARYGNAGIGVWSWGTMNGNGRAIKFIID
jgi:hypothetical protein